VKSYSQSKITLYFSEDLYLAERAYFWQCLFANGKPSFTNHKFETDTEYSLPFTSCPKIPIGYIFSFVVHEFKKKL
jgi:hypothetical protein